LTVYDTKFGELAAAVVTSDVGPSVGRIEAAHFERMRIRQDAE